MIVFVTIQKTGGRHKSPKAAASISPSDMAEKGDKHWELAVAKVFDEYYFCDKFSEALLKVSHKNNFTIVLKPRDKDFLVILCL